MKKSSWNYPGIFLPWFACYDLQSGLTMISSVVRETIANTGWGTTDHQWNTDGRKKPYVAFHPF